MQSDKNLHCSLDNKGSVCTMKLHLHVSLLFNKGNNFFYFMFASLGKIALPTISVHLRDSLVVCLAHHIKNMNVNTSTQLGEALPIHLYIHTGELKMGGHILSKKRPSFRRGETKKKRLVEFVSSKRVPIKVNLSLPYLHKLLIPFLVTQFKHETCQHTG